MPEERIKEIERLAMKYPLTTMEAIVKSDVLRMGLNFTESALEKTEGCAVRTYRLFTYDRAEFDQFKKGEPFRVPEVLSIQGGQYNLRRTFIQIRLNPDSPYRVDVVDGKLTLWENSHNIAEVEYLPAPDYFNKTLPDGMKMSEIAAYVGSNIFCTVYRICQYWGPKEECLFCDINQNVRQGTEHKKLVIPKAARPVEEVVDTLEEVFLRSKGFVIRPRGFLITGGAILDKVNGKDEDDFYLEYVERIRERIGYRWYCTLQIGPKDKKTYQRYRDAGVTSVHAQYEVWDKNLFKIICPGKSERFGWDCWMKSILDSVDIFGEGNVCPGFVAGVEMCQPYGFKDVDSAIKSTTGGLDFLMSHGVTPRYNAWNVSPLSALAGNQPPPLEYYVRLDLAWCQLMNKYNLTTPTTFGELGPGRPSTGGNHAAYADVDPVKCEGWVPSYDAPPLPWPDWYEGDE